MNNLIADLQHEFRRHRRLAERAIGAIDDSVFIRKPDTQVNSVALIVKHLAGNLRARWTDFMSRDGDAGRNRDEEFVLGPADKRAHLMEQWNAAWAALEATLATLTEANLQTVVTIRGEPHTAQQALLRSLSHTTYHVGQILYLVRLWKPDAPWLTIAPGESKNHKAGYLKK